MCSVRLSKVPSDMRIARDRAIIDKHYDLAHPGLRTVEINTLGLGTGPKEPDPDRETNAGKRGRPKRVSASILSHETLHELDYELTDQFDYRLDRRTEENNV